MRNKKTSTAALGSVCEWPDSESRGVPCHSPGARRDRRQRSKKSNEEDAVSLRIAEPGASRIRTILPVMLRIAFSVVLWTLGCGMTMKLAAEPAKEHRKEYTFAVDRAQAENLQRWVNAGHDSWCRDPQLAASATLRRIAEELEGVEVASLPVEQEQREKTAAIYTFHSLDGRRTYRMTMRRHAWLLPTAGSLQRMIWVPEKVEIVTRETLD